MNNLKIFESEEFGSVRTIQVNGKIFFCGSDVAKALGYSQTAKAVREHCREDGCLNQTVIDSMGRMQQAKFIDEGNLYRLIVHSKLPSAEKFERWVFDDILPTLRKTGSYTMPGKGAGRSVYEKKATSVGEVVNLVKTVRKAMTKAVRPGGCCECDRRTL